MNMDNNKSPETHNGKYIKVNNKVYQLTPETVSKGCKGCVYESKMNCHSTLDNNKVTLTDYCRQGFIFKKVNV